MRLILKLYGCEFMLSYNGVSLGGWILFLLCITAAFIFRFKAKGEVHDDLSGAN